MYGPKNKNGALAALAAAGGLWAWQNRDKIKGWINQYSQQYSQQGQFSGASPSTPRAVTGETRRISPEDLDRIVPNDTRTPGENI